MEKNILKSIQTTDKVTFIDNEHLDGYYYPELKIVHFKWKKRTVGEPYRKAFMDAADYAAIHPTKYFLSDICNQGVVGPVDRKWFESVALPAAIKNGVIKVGIVFDGNSFKMYYINIILKNFMNKGVPMQFFKEEGLAAEWLLSDKVK